jgi:uncharacterized protein (DUF433 family)
MESFISPAKAAYIAGLDDRQINRMVDEKIGPTELVRTRGASRLVAPLYAALARFYYETDAIFQSEARREVIKEFASRLSKSPRRNQWLALSDTTEWSIWSQLVDQPVSPVEPAMARPASLENAADMMFFDDENSWFLVIEFKGYPVHLAPYIGRSAAKAREVDQAEELVHSSPDILGGTPVFRGTRLPIENVLSALARGQTSDALLADYPDLTAAHISAAQVYSTVNPRRGRPPRLRDLHPDLIPKATKVLRPGRS